MKIVNFFLAAAIGVAALNCSAAKTETDSLNSAANITTVVANSGITTTNQQSAAEQSQQTATAPDALVRDLYKQHDAENSPFFQAKNRASVDKYFEKGLADIIWKDAEDSNGEVGALGADPLYDAQDSDIKNFAVGQPKINNDKAEVIVSFTNFGKKESITYELIKQNAVWKISDIKYADYTLLGNYKENAKLANEPSGRREFEGTYQVGDTTCTVKPIKMAFEVKWTKGSGSEIFFSRDRANDKYIFASDPEKGKADIFSFDDQNYNTGTFYRADGKELSIRKIS